MAGGDKQHLTLLVMGGDGVGVFQVRVRELTMDINVWRAMLFILVAVSLNCLERW